MSKHSSANSWPGTTLCCRNWNLGQSETKTDDINHGEEETFSPQTLLSECLVSADIVYGLITVI